jgi:aminopeptidase N
MTKTKTQTQDPAAARLAWKQTRDALRKQIAAKRRQADKAHGANRPLDERQYREEVGALELELLTLDQRYQQQERSLLVGEFDRRDEILPKLRQAVADGDQAIFAALDALAQAVEARCAAQLELASTQNRMSNTARRYDLPETIAGMHPGLLPWHQVISGPDAELPGAVLAAFANRFVSLYRGNARPHSLADLVNRGGE